LIKKKRDALSKATRKLNKDVSKIAIPMTSINVTNFNDSQNMAIQNNVFTTLVSGNAMDVSGKLIDEKYLKDMNVLLGTNKELPLGAQLSFMNTNGAQGLSGNEVIAKVVIPNRDEDGKLMAGTYSTIYMKYDGSSKGAVISNMANMANIAYKQSKVDPTKQHAAATVSADISSYIGATIKLDVNGRKLDSWQLVNELKILHDKKGIDHSKAITGKLDDKTTFTLKKQGDSHYTFDVNYDGNNYNLQMISLNSIPVILGALTGESYGLSKEVRKSVISKFIKE